MFIARVYLLITVCTVKGGQRKGSKHVVSFPQNVSRIANTLPQLPSDIPIVVRRTNAEGMRHYDFRVRQLNVRAALTWLKENNKWYHDIVISEDRLSQLDEDGNIEDGFHRVSQGEPERMDDEGPREEETSANENPINEYTTEGYIAMAFPTLFPYGHADFRNHSQRDTSIKVAEFSMHS